MSFSPVKDEPNNDGRTDNIVKLLRVLFHDYYCPQQLVPAEKKFQVLSAHFCGWLDRNANLMNVEDICEKAGVTTDIWYAVMHIIEGGSAPESFAPVWYGVVLSDRPKLQNEVASINVVVNVTYTDKSIITSQAFVAREMMSMLPGELDDAVFATILYNTMQQLLETMMGEGLDKLHVRAAMTPLTSTEPEDPFDVMMGGLLKYVIPNLKQALQAPVTNYMRLAQQCIRPPIPPQAIAAYQARQAKQKMKEQGKAVGGWNTDES